jgi:hypothetical protein
LTAERLPAGARRFAWTCHVTAIANVLICLLSPAWAAEGFITAGPVGGSDIRTALLPPPGLYGALFGAYTTYNEVDDGSGHPVAGLDAVHLDAVTGGAALFYSPDVQILGGSIGLWGLANVAQDCGQAVSAFPSRCISGLADPYVEANWGRFFGHLRPSREPGAFPIAEGLAIDVGLGAVLPVGRYDPNIRATNGITVGNNTLDIAPSVAFTFTTPPLLAEGTEFSAKIYYNEYRTNPATHYHSGSLIDVDFALTEHIGRFQIGPAGTYLDQVANDKINGVTVGPDGNKIKVLVLGPVRRTRRAVPYFARRVRRLDVSRTARDRAGGGGLSADMRPHEQQPKPVKP